MCTGKYGKYHVLCIVVQWITSEINEAGKYTSTIRKRRNKLLTWRALFTFNTLCKKIEEEIQNDTITCDVIL